MTELTDELEEVLEVEEVFEDAYDAIESIEGEMGTDLEGFILGFGEPPTERPKQTRQKKVQLAWEEYLSFLKKDEYQGRWVYVFEFSSTDARAKAKARARTVRNRLKKSQIDEVWDIKFVQDRDDSGELVDTWKVWAQYVRPATDEEIATRELAAESARERGRHAAEVRLAKQASM